MAGLQNRSKLDPSELKIALENRAFEIQLFWVRSNYFLVLMTALGIGAFSVKDSIFSPLISAFATIASYFWFRTNLGSKFWQESWEVEVSMLSKELGVRSFERSLTDVRKQVENSLKSGQISEKRSGLRKWVYNMTVRKYSVTYNMILLSLFSTILWFVVTSAFIGRAVFMGTEPKVSGLTAQPNQIDSRQIARPRRANLTPPEPAPAAPPPAATPPAYRPPPPRHSPPPPAAALPS